MALFADATLNQEKLKGWSYHPFGELEMSASEPSGPKEAARVP